MFFILSFLFGCSPIYTFQTKQKPPYELDQQHDLEEKCSTDFVEGCRFCQRMERTGETLLKIPDYKEISPGHWVEMCPICLDENEDKWE